MPKHFFLLALGGTLLSACVPGPELDRPPVEGTVTDARTHRPVSGAYITVAKTNGDLPGQDLPNTLSDAAGHFTLTARYKLGVILVYGDPPLTPVTINIRREGYESLDLRQTYNFFGRSSEPIRVDAALEPDLPPGPMKNCPQKAASS